MKNVQVLSGMLPICASCRRVREDKGYWRQIEAYVQNPDWGGLRLGFGSTASYLTTEVDMSGTAVASYVNIADVNGGFAFRPEDKELRDAFNAALVEFRKTDDYKKILGTYGLSEASIKAAAERKVEDLCAGK